MIKLRTLQTLSVSLFFRPLELSSCPFFIWARKDMNLSNSTKIIVDYFQLSTSQKRHLQKPFPLYFYHRESKDKRLYQSGKALSIIKHPDISLKIFPFNNGVFIQNILQRTALFSNATAKIRPIFFAAKSFLYLFSEELVKS